MRGVDLALYEIAAGARPPSLPEGAVLGRGRITHLYDAYRPPRPAVLAALRRKNDCCKKHPGDPTVSLDITWTPTLDAKVTIHASHPCGIEHVTVYIAEKHVELMQPGDVPVESYDGKLVHGHHIDKSADINAGGPVTKEFTLPTGELTGDVFYVAGTATSACKTSAGAHRGAYLIT